MCRVIISFVRVRSVSPMFGTLGQYVQKVANAERERDRGYRYSTSSIDEAQLDEITGAERLNPYYCLSS
jgi:hypothetical protein